MSKDGYKNETLKQHRDNAILGPSFVWDLSMFCYSFIRNDAKWYVMGRTLEIRNFSRVWCLKYYIVIIFSILWVTSLQLFFAKLGDVQSYVTRCYWFCHRVRIPFEANFNNHCRTKRGRINKFTRVGYQMMSLIHVVVTFDEI